MGEPELAPGSVFERTIEPITLRDIVRYAGASGDFNPSHYDRDLAVRSGFQSNFAQGMFTAGLLGVALGEWFSPDRIRSFGVQFVAPLWCGDAPHITATVTRIENGNAHLDLLTTVDGRAVIRGWAGVTTEPISFQRSRISS